MIQKELNISYAENFNDLRKANLYIPDRKVNGVLFIHGGGWVNGKKEQWDEQAIYFAEQDYLTMTISYRLAPTWNIPAQIEDARLAIQYFKKRAAFFGANPSKLAIVGSSAGSHLALLMASISPGDYLGKSDELKDTQTIPQIVIAYNPVCSLQPNFHCEKVDDLVKVALGFDSGQEVDAFLVDCSPFDRVAQTKSTILIYQGTSDELTTADSVRRYYEEANSAGVTITLKELSNEAHGFGYGMTTIAQKECVDTTKRFLKEFLI